MAELLHTAPLSARRDGLVALGRRISLRTVVGGGIALIVVVVLAQAWLRPTAARPRLTLPTAEPGSAPATGGGGAPAPAGAGAPAPGPAVAATVDVAGQVAAPGVYALPSGARVADAIVAAGGASAEADLDQLNLAAKMADGERVYVPKKGEPTPAGASPAASAAGSPPPVAGPVDLNTATAEQLDALPGVGPATSKAIVTYRTSHGRFRSVTELLEVPGIGPAKLEALRPLVRV